MFSGLSEVGECQFCSVLAKRVLKLRESMKVKEATMKHYVECQEELRRCNQLIIKRLEGDVEALREELKRALSG
ncbi:hypothetical protein ERJ75_000015300 [Trypanosoma vivax]|nr:hypothetical protein ERJ75_000701700 [Trypanosoma vivax]KAH8620897.1 hypothetical protein ERJ75_000015300 [Trypanosoma vivax]